MGTVLAVQRQGSVAAEEPRGRALGVGGKPCRMYETSLGDELSIYANANLIQGTRALRSPISSVLLNTSHRWPLP
jgi:hypothetical protein